MATSTPPSRAPRMSSRKSSGSTAAAAWRWRRARCSRSHDPASDLLTVWSGTQTPHIGRRMLADLLGRDLQSIRMIAPDVGGGFGPKAIFYPEEAVIPAVALKLGRPVKWIEDRREHFLCATQERDQYWDVAIAVDAGGKDPRRSRPHAARLRRVRAVGHHHALHRRRDRARPLCDPGLSSSTPWSCSPTRCRPRRCAAPAGRRRCSRWSGCWTASPANCSSIAPRCAAAI